MHKESYDEQAPLGIARRVLEKHTALVAKEHDFILP